jgi:alkanesulfonate monooxygenase SsuD/methylene tetrahydromethanopterin reductase-like flavin-dependent oxidoreductase (luciferase family)
MHKSELFIICVRLDVFGIGEHHRREFLDSAPAIILAAAVARTKRIRLTSAVTVLSAADPVRVFLATTSKSHVYTIIR